MTSISRFAELAGLVAEDGLLGSNLFPTERVVVPAVLSLDGDYLVWDMFDRKGEGRQAQRVEPRGALDLFMKLRDGCDVLRFARKYGVLGLCEHGLPASHNARPLSMISLWPAPLWCLGEGWKHPVSPRDLWCKGGNSDSHPLRPVGRTLAELIWAEPCQPVGWPTPREPIARWLYFARQAQALVNIAAALHRNRPASRQDWETVFEGALADPEECESVTRLVTDLVDGFHDSRLYIEGIINEWIGLGGVRARLRWRLHEGAPYFELSGGAFGALAVQLMVAVTQAHRLAVCDGCLQAYPRTGRAPQTGRRNFCSVCRDKKVPLLWAQRDKRIRDRMKKEQSS